MKRLLGRLSDAISDAEAAGHPLTATMLQTVFVELEREFEDIAAEAHVQLARWARLKTSVRSLSALIVRARLPEPEFVRAGGDVTCDRCGLSYYDHPEYPGYEFLHVLCDGRAVKL